MPVCPICNKEIASESTQGPFPFCSVRCKQVDLYHWLNEEYRIDAPPGPDALDELESQGDSVNRGTSS